MKHWKKQGKRGLSLFLSVVMCLSMVNLTAFAVGDGLKTGEVVKGAFVAGDGKLGAHDESASRTVTIGDGKVEVTKTAEPVRCEDGNQFEVTLTVKTTDQEITKVESPDAAVSLVIDVSGSMKACAECGEHQYKANGWYNHASTCSHYNPTPTKNYVNDNQTRLYAAKQSATKFLDSLKANTPQNADGTYPARYVSVVAFASEANRQCGWQNIMTDDGYKAVLSAINDLKADGSTNLEQGLSKANSLMQDSTVNKVDESNKFTVVLTDGEPTYAKSGQSKIGDGKAASKKICDETVDTAKTLKENSNAIYSVYYGDASKTCYKKVTIEAFLKSFSDSAESADTADKLNIAFKNISQTITLLTKAWKVSDPMGPGVQFEEVTSGQGTCVTSAEGGLTWNLKADTPTVNGNTRTYTLKYLVTVDATGVDYDEEAVHALNDYTYLTYVIEGADGGYTDAYGNPVSGENPPTIGFNVPGVKVQRPVRPWRIEYYKQGNATAGDYENYTQVTGNTQTGESKVQSKVELAAKDPEWETKYSNENYKCVSSNQTITIQADSENVIKVYYDRKTTSATVNYHYTLTTIFENGQEFTDTDDVPGTAVSGLFVGEEYSANAPETSTYGGYTYKFDRAEPSTTIKALDKDGGKNVIDLYYVKEIDYRRDASVVVNHVYTLHTYELKDDKYVDKDVVVEVPNAEVVESGLKAGETYTASYYPTAEFGSYGYMGIAGRDNVKVLREGKNVITLEFENREDPRGEELSLTVKHHYTKSVTTIDAEGKVVTTVEPNNAVVEETVNFYAGETVTIAEQNSYGDPADIYGSASENASQLEIKNATASDNGTVIDLYYSLVEAPEKTTVTVEHVYQTTTYETVTKYKEIKVEVPAVDANGDPVYQEEIDPDTGNAIQVPVMTTETRQVEDGTEQKVTTVEDHRFSDAAVTVYVGQKYTAEGKPNGYTPTVQSNVGYTADKANVYEVIASADGSNTITLVYTRDLTVDNRGDTSIGVIHEYTYRVKTVIGGKVQTLENVFRSDRTEYTGKPGDSFTAQPEPEVGNKIYTQTTPEADLSVVLKASNGDIVIKYTLEEELLTETSYTVNYEYYTRSMTVVDGVAVWGEPVTDETVSKEAVIGTGYAGQKVELETGAMSGYNAMEGNPSSIQFLAESGNEWTFKYVKDVPLAQVPVTVNHHVTTRTLTIDSESSFEQTYAGRPEYKYVGESYEAKALDIGTLTLVNVNGDDVDTQKTVTFNALTGAVVVDFYYEIVNDLRRPVDYSIQYYYYDVDYDGTETLTGEPPAATGSSFAGKPLATTPEEEDVKGYRLTEATFNEVDIMGQQSVTLVDGENKVVYVYKRHVDNRPVVHATVYHEYYSSASATEPAYRDSVVTNDLRVGASFAATAVPTKNGVAYTQTTPDSALTITVSADYGSNVITIKYVLAETTYKVVHTYYTNGSLTGSSDPVTVGGSVGDVVTADSVAKALNYGGNSYSYTSSSGALTLVQGENGTITLRYDRTTGGGGGGGNNNDDDDDNGGGGTPTTPVVDVPDEQPPLIEEPVIDIPDEQPPMEEIPEEEIPEEEIPEEEILEEEVPLSDVPQTGDNSKPAFWAALGGLSFLGIVLLGRKRKDEEA